MNQRDPVKKQKAHQPALQSPPAGQPSELFHLLVEAVRDCALFSIDAAGNVTSWNPGAELLKGYKAGEILGRHFSLFYTAEERAGGKPQRDLEVALAEGCLEEEGVRVRKDGSTFWAIVTTTALRDCSGHHVGFAKMTRDTTERKRAEQALAEEAIRRRILVEQSRDGIVVLDQNGRVDEANQRYADMLGYSAEEVRQLYVWDWDARWTREQLLEKIRLDDAGGHHFETRQRRKDGTLIDVEISSNGAVCGGQKLVFCVCRDISERKKAEHALQESKERFRELYDNAPVGYHEYDIEGRISRVNQTDLEMLGYTAEEMIGHYVWEFNLDEEKAHYEIIEKLSGSRPPGRSLERTYKRKDGTTLPVLIEDRLIRDGHGQITGIRCVIQDITERNRAEHALKQSEASAMQLAQENAAMAEIGRIIGSTLNIDEVYESFAEEVKKIIPFDRIVINTIDTEKGTVRNVYIAGDELRGRNTEDPYPLEGSGSVEMVRTNSSVLIQTEDFSEYKDRFPKLLSTFQAGFRSIMNVPLFSKGKVIGGLLLRSRKPFAYADDDMRLAERIGSQIAGAVANAQLYTERIKAEDERAAIEERLRQSQKMEAIGALAGGVAHDFNNLLTVITGHCELLQMTLPENDPNKRALGDIHEAARRAASLTRQLLAFSRKQMLEPKVLDPNEIVDNIEKMLRRLIGEDVVLTTVLSPGISAVKVDPGQMEQVVINLAVNARDAMPQGGRLTIETHNIELNEDYCRFHSDVKPGRYTLLSMTDNGCGMTPEVKRRIFEPFFTTKGPGKGTGLGLATVFGIVKQSDGHIQVYSEVGVGTCFKIYLPAVEAKTASPQSDRSVEPARMGKETILLVEDEEGVRQVAKLILEKHGYKVLEANDGPKAITIAESLEGRIDLVLTDVVMPEMSGTQLTGLLRARHSGLKVLFMSGYTDDAMVRHGLIDAKAAFLHKPFSAIALAKKVREILDGKNEL
jgi:PAS domain S-box-containing protein